MNVERVGDFKLQWGESLVWDERRARLYFVDTRDGHLVVTMDDGLYVVDVDNEK